MFILTNSCRTFYDSLLKDVLPILWQEHGDHVEFLCIRQHQPRSIIGGVSRIVTASTISFLFTSENIECLGLTYIYKTSNKNCIEHRTVPDMVCLNGHHPMGSKELMEYAVPPCSLRTQGIELFFDTAVETILHNIKQLLDRDQRRLIHFCIYRTKAPVSNDVWSNCN